MARRCDISVDLTIAQPRSAFKPWFQRNNKSLPPADGIKSWKRQKGIVSCLKISHQLLFWSMPLHDTSANGTALLIWTALAIPTLQACWILSLNSQGSFFFPWKIKKHIWISHILFFLTCSSLHCEKVGKKKKKALEQWYSLNYTFSILHWDIILGSTKAASLLYCQWGIVGQIQILLPSCVLWSL